MALSGHAQCADIAVATARLVFSAESIAERE